MNFGFSKNRQAYFYFATLIFVAIMLFAGCTSDTESKKNEAYKEKFSAKLYALNQNEDSLKAILQKSIKEKNDVAVMLCYKEIGKRQRENSAFSDAIASHQEGLNVALKLNDTTEIVQAFNNLGTDFRRIGALSEASDYHYRALGYAEAYSGVNTPVGMKNRVIAMNGIGNISLTLRYFGDAEKYFRAALKDEIALKSPIGQAINLANIGSIFEERQQYDSAHIYYQRSLEQNLIGKSDMGIGLCFIHLGDLYKTQKKYREAQGEYEKAYNLMEKIADRWHWLESCLSIAQIHMLTDNLQTFIEYIQMAEDVAMQIKSPEHMAIIYELKHHYSIKKGDFRTALKYYKLSHSMQDSVQGIQKANRHIDMRINYERERNAQHIKQIEVSGKIKQRDCKLNCVNKE